MIECMAGVIRVEDGFGYRHLPVYDPKWAVEKKIAWKLAVTKIDTGLDVSVFDANSSTKVLGRWVADSRRNYGIAFPGGGMTVGGLDEIWSALTAMGIGYSIAKNQFDDPEEFCSSCLAGIESPEHFQKCGGES